MISRRIFLQSASAAFLALGPEAARASNAPGVTDTEIKIGQTMPYSGPVSAYGVIGRTEGKLRAARAYHFATAEAAWQELLDTGKLSEQGRAAIRLSATYTIHQAAEVVDTAYHMTGATAVFTSNPFERRFRDMHAITQQIQGRDTHYEDVGKMILTNKVIPRGPTA